MRVFLIVLTSVLLLGMFSCDRSGDVFTVAVVNGREDTIVLEKHFASNGAMHEIPVYPGRTFYLFEKQGEWQGVEVESRLRYDSLIIVVDSLRIFISKDSSSYFEPNPFEMSAGWESRMESDEDDNPRHLYFLTIPGDSVLFKSR